MKLSFFLVVLLLTAVANAQTPELVLPIGHTSRVQFASFSPDGQRIVSSSQNEPIYLWEARSGHLLKRLGDVYGGYQGYFSPSGDQVLTISIEGENNYTTLWDVRTGIPLVKKETLLDKSEAWFIQNGQSLAIRNRDSIWVYTTATGKLTFKDTLTFFLDNNEVFLKDHLLKRISRRNYKFYIAVVDIRNGQTVKEVALEGVEAIASDKSAESFRFSPAGTYLTHRGDDTVYLFHTETGKLIASHVQNRQHTYDALVWFDKTDHFFNVVYTNRFNDSLAVINLKDFSTRRYGYHGKPVITDSAIYLQSLWRVTMADIGTVNQSRIQAIHFYSGKDTLLYTINKEIDNFAVAGAYLSFGLPDSAGKSDFLKSIKQTIILDKTTGQEVARYNGELITQQSSIAFPNRLLLYTHQDHGISQWEVGRRYRLSQIKSYTTMPTSLAFLDSNRYLFTGSQLLDVRNSRVVHSYPGRFGSIDPTNNRIKIQLDNRVALVQAINNTQTLQLPGLLIDNEADNWSYLMTQQQDTVYVASLIKPSVFKAKGMYKGRNETKELLLTTVNAGYYYYDYDYSEREDSKNEKPLDETTAPVTTLWQLSNGNIYRQWDYALRHTVFDSTEENLRYLVMLHASDTTGDKWGYTTYVYEVVTNQLLSFKGRYKNVYEKEQIIETEDNGKRLHYSITSGQLQPDWKETARPAASSREREVIINHFDTSIVISHASLTLPRLYYKSSRLENSTDYIIDSFRVLDVDGRPLSPYMPVDIEGEERLARNPDYISFSSNKNWMFLMAERFHEVANLKTGKLVPLQKLFPKETIRKGSFSSSGNVMITESIIESDYLLKLAFSIWNSNTGERIAHIEAPVTERLFFTVSPDARFGSIFDKGLIKIYNLETGKELYSFLPIVGVNTMPDYLARIPSGYYMSSPAAAKLLHYVTPDLKVISFEQLDLKYNRPDLVLQSIGSADTTLIQLYRKAYEKRIQRLGIDTTSFRSDFGVPEVDFSNRKSIGYEQSTKQIQLHIKGKDGRYPLDRFNVWVNEAPLFGQKGISLRQNRSSTIDTTITITLSQGGNQIETSVINVNATESYRIPLFVKYSPLHPVKEKLHFVGIGLNRFQDSVQNLQWSVKDIRDLAKHLNEKLGDAIIIDTLFDEKVSKSSITAMKAKLNRLTPSDKVLVAYSGHGLLSKEFDYYLSTYSVNFQKPEQEGIPYEILESLLDSIPARKKLMLIDACHSGEVDKEELQKIAQVNKAAARTEGARGNEPLVLSPKKTGMKNSFELMQQVFVNVGRSTGATIISAAGGTQFALERGDLKNGVFTYSILEYLQAHSTATVSELKSYVNKRVPELTKGAQQPTTRTETKQVDWEVW